MQTALKAVALDTLQMGTPSEHRGPEELHAESIDATARRHHASLAANARRDATTANQLAHLASAAKWHRSAFITLHLYPKAHRDAKGIKPVAA